LIKIEYS